MSFNIAIDGPAGAGKSTVARRVAEELGFIYVDTGAMYRTIALYLMRNQIDCEDQGQLLAALDQIHIGISYEDGVQQLILNGENVTGLIRTEEVGRMASSSSAKPQVREKLLQLQRSLAENHDVLMDGRDIGTVILPDARLKVYLTASVEARALRRYREYMEKGTEVTLQKIQEDIQKRDQQDMNREVSPLKQAEDAILVDSSDMTIDQVVTCIKDLAMQRGA